MIRELLKKVILHIRMWEADQTAHFWGVYYHMLFPPSYYMSHTEEEIRRDTAAELAELRKMLEEFED